MQVDLRPYHARLSKKLEASLVGNTQRIRIKKKTVSNLFRYEVRKQSGGRQVDLRDFNKPLYLDVKAKTLEVQGLATYESIVDFTLPSGFLPTITPELKHITIGGATVGIGIESNSYKYGFVHDGLLEAEVLLPDGKIVVCTPDNKYSDLFYGLPNSYGTLGYILRVKIQLREAKQYVKLRTELFTSCETFLTAMKKATAISANDYVESLVYSKKKLYLITGQQTDKANKVTSIYGNNIFYKEVSTPGTIFLTTKEYIFRYDPEWFWAVPESPMYSLFRTLAPRGMRNSSFYTHYVNWQRAISAKLPFIKFEDDRLEQLIQDWEVTWSHSAELMNFALDTFELDGRPLVVTSVKTPARATFYPMQKNSLYLNLGSYSYVRKKPNQPDYYNTKVTDQFCFRHNGIKMLYSTTFVKEAAFNKIYNGQAQVALKDKYDPKHLLPTLYDKAVKAR